MLREIVRITREQEVDAVLVAGDLYDSAAPSAAAQRLVVRTLMALAATGAQVVVIAGNHDHAATLDAYRPFAGAAGVTLVGSVRTAEAGGVVEFTARSGERATVAVLPFLSQRYAVRAAELVAQSPGGEHRHVRPAGALAGAGAHRRVPDGRGEPRDGAPDRARRQIRWRRAGRTVDLRVLGARGDLPDGRPLRRAGPSAPASVARRAGAGALLRCAAGRRLRRAGQHERRAAGRGHTHHAGPGHGHPDHGGPAAADGARHGGRAGRHARRGRRRPAARLGAGTRPGRDARGGDRPAAERAGGADRPGVRRAGRVAPGPAAAPARTAARASCSTSSWARGRSTTGASRSCSPGCTTGSARSRRASDAAGAAGDGGVRGVPRARRRRLRRRGVLRAGRPDGRREVDGDRRADVRAVRHGAPLGRPAGRGAGPRAEREPRCRAAGVRRPRRTGSSPCGSCAAPRGAG